MGSVYEGEHTATGRRVALKLVHVHSPVHAELEQRFEREARIASNVRSKHIVQVFDAGRDAVLGPFIAMELLEGQDLETHLACVGTLTPKKACEVAYQAARGLEKAHAANVAHRDLKPGNLFLVDSDEDEFLVKVLDFGIAKLFEDDRDANIKLTREGSTVGTPLYMSPEQARGLVDIDGRTDVYSLGAVIYESIVGRSHVPELANYNQLVVHIATQPAPRLSQAIPDIDPRIDRLVSEMLIADRRDRIQTMAAVRERLAMILGMSRRMLPSTADGSDSFLAVRDSARAFPALEKSSERSISTMRAADQEDEGEEVLFFDRSSFSQPAAKDVSEESPDSESESVALFDRSSLRIALSSAPDRTSSGAHVVDARSPSHRPSSRPPPPPLHPPARTSRPPIAPIATAAPVAKKGANRALIATAIALLALIVAGSVRIATMSSGSPPRSAIASPAANPVDIPPPVAPPAATLAPSAMPLEIDAAAAPIPPPVATAVAP
jgi:serine/threonine protein kinase